ncbi:hypothetical protein NKI56_18015 [Mesorhizobium sp. M0622]|uniref:hypothetical protein n=1 Tax=Mesorhizobium sp. M0622 TaxID=2956975 RepID=UPI003335EA0D
MTEVTKHALRVYSSISALRGKNGDVLDAVIPFFDPILRIMDGKIFDPKLIVSGVHKMYHWRMTREIVEQFIPRLLALKLLEKHGTGSKTMYVVTYRAAAVPDDSAEITQTFEAIIDEFAKFPPIVTDLLTYSRTRDELADILIRFLVSSNVLFQANGALPNVVTGSLGELDKLPEGGRPLPDYDKYMAARFVQHLLKERGDLVPYLSTFASIGLLTEVVDDFVRPTDHAAQTDLTIVVDGPLALDYLGLSGKDIQTDIRTVLDGLRTVGCKIVVFPVTCGEMSQNLKAMLGNSPSDRYGYTHSAMVAGEVLSDYVLSVANNPEGALETSGIGVKDANLTHYPNSHKYFTQEMHDDFMSKIAWGADIRSREHDADCLTLLMRLRDGKHSRDLFNCRYVFVTRNVSFARQSREYCLTARQLYATQEGPVVHQRDLATIAWLRTGLGATEAIPRNLLVAHCNRVLQVRPELMQTVKDKLRAFSPEKLEQYQALLLDQRSIRKLADATLNDEKVVTGDNAAELLELMRSATAEAVKSEYEAKLADEKKKHSQAQRAASVKHVGDLSEREEEMRTLRESLSRAERERGQFDDQRGQAVSTMLAAVNRNSGVVRTVANLSLIALGLAFIADACVGIFPATNVGWSWALRGLGVVGIYQTIAGLLHWPQWGLTDILDWNARRKLRAEIVERGLGWITSADFKIINGKVEKPLVIDHNPSEGRG